MAGDLRIPAAAVALLLTLSATDAALAEKQGGILKVYSLDSPASMSIHEEATVFAQRPMMGVFNNLVIFKQDVKQNSLQSVVPDLATGWSWSEDGTELTFPLREGITRAAAAAGKGRQEPVAGNLRSGADKCQPQPDNQSGQAALRQP